MTLTEAHTKITGILQHPAFDKTLPDLVIAPHIDGTITISGPRTHLDGILPVLQRCGFTVTRPAPAVLLAAYR